MTLMAWAEAGFCVLLLVLMLMLVVICACVASSRADDDDMLMPPAEVDQYGERPRTTAEFHERLEATRIADWKCTRCGALKNGWTNPPCQAQPGEACPMVPVNAQGQVLSMSALPRDYGLDSK